MDRVLRVRQMLAAISQEGKENFFMRPFWARRSAFPDRDRTPTPNTYDEAAKRICLFHTFWQTGQYRDDLARNTIDFIRYSGDVKRILNRTNFAREITIGEDPGWTGAIRECLNGGRGGMQYVYDQLVFNYITLFEDDYCDAVIGNVIPRDSGMAEMQQYWNANLEILRGIAPNIPPGTEVAFMANFRGFLKEQARLLDPLLKFLNPFGDPSRDANNR